jgi:hypothetical protein
VAQKLEPGFRKEVLDVPLVSGEKVINAENLMSLFQQSVYQVRAKKARTTGYKNPLPGRVFARQFSFLL